MKRTASVFVELIALLFIAGLVAVVAIPDQRPTKPESQHRALISALERVRTALDRYWGDHNARYPTIEEMQTLPEAAKASRARIELAAYLGGVPDNPFTGGSAVAPLDAPVGWSDWVYEPQTGVFKANDSIVHRAL
ncbi:MAG: hypothetical protein V3W34_07210 [Phycisphaerae bacterium]